MAQFECWARAPIGAKISRHLPISGVYVQLQLGLGLVTSGQSSSSPTGHRQSIFTRLRFRRQAFPRTSTVSYFVNFVSRSDTTLIIPKVELPPGFLVKTHSIRVAANI